MMTEWKIGDRFTITRFLGTFSLEITNITEKRVVFRFDGERPLAFTPSRFAKMLAK